MGKKNYAVEKPQIRETARGWHIEYLLTAPDGSSTRRRPAFNLNSIEDLAVRRMVAERIVEALPDMIIVVEATPPVPQEHAIYIYAALELMVDEMYTKGRTTAKGNYRTAASHLRRWLQKENIGDCLLGAIGKTQARQFRQHLQRSGLSARTAKNYTDCLNTMWNDLPEMGIEVPNPWAKMPRTRPVPKKRRTYTAEEKRIVVAELEKHYWMYRALLLLYYCGVRRNKMCRLRFSDIDLEKGIIHIYDHAAKNYRTRHSTIPAVILPHFLYGTFDHFPKNHYIFGEKWQPNPKKPLCPNTISKVHRRILEGIVEAGKLPAEALVGLDFYAWKDTAITLHIHRTNPVSTRDQIGHASLDQTMQYYHAVLVNEEYRRLSDTLHE